MQSDDGGVETGVDHERLAFLGPGGRVVALGPGAAHFDLEFAPGCHLCAPVEELGKLRPRALWWLADGGQRRPESRRRKRPR
eukprot:6753930-Pyramimonas_sp.AAC.1